MAIKMQIGKGPKVDVQQIMKPTSAPCGLERMALRALGEPGGLHDYVKGKSWKQVAHLIH